MAHEYITVDVTDAPDLQRLAEAVRQTGKPHALKQGGKTIAVVRPVSRKRRQPERSAGASPRGRDPQPNRAASAADPAVARLIDGALAANREEAEKTRALLAPPSSEELARRAAAYDEIQTHRHTRIIAPLTSADLVQLARAEDGEADGTSC